MRSSWDERYAARPGPVEPCPAVVQVCAPLPAGRAVDLASGAGRHARWLAARGWTVSAVDLSAVGTAQARALAGDLPVEWVVGDALVWQPTGPVDLVLAVHVQLGVAGLRRAAGWLAPGGHLVVVGHERGLRDPALLHAREQLEEVAQGLEQVRLDRLAAGSDRPQLLLVARRPTAGSSAGVSGSAAPRRPRP